jgi:PIN like domain
MGEPAYHVHDYFGPGTDDETWMRYAAERGWCIVSRDVRITRRPHERAALTGHRIGAFFLLPGPASPDRCTMIQTVIKHWPTMKRLAAATPRPFQQQITRRGVKRFR